MTKTHRPSSRRMKENHFEAPATSILRALQRQARSLASKQYTAGEIGPGRGRTRHLGMDITWVTDRIALGGGIWNTENMAELARTGITHIIDMQIEFDDTSLAEPYAIQVLWNPTDDDFQHKAPELFEHGVGFAAEALDQKDSKLFIHCAAGVHRAPMMTLAILCSMGWDLDTAMETIASRRPVVDFADVYVSSVENFLQQQMRTAD